MRTLELRWRNAAEDRGDGDLVLGHEPVESVDAARKLFLVALDRIALVLDPKLLQHFVPERSHNVHIVSL